MVLEEKEDVVMLVNVRIIDGIDPSHLTLNNYDGTKNDLQYKI
jgi:hypothetical protein